MSRLRFPVLVVLLLLLSPLAVSPTSAQYEDLVDRARPALVLIRVETDGGKAEGTGFFIDPEGYIATARHVIEDANRIVVMTRTGRELPATVVRYSTLFDAAVLKVNGGRVPFLAFGDSEALRQGQEILVLGYPFGSGLGTDSITVTRGIISALRPSEGLIQYDAGTNPGNSGGPVLNLRGEVVGIHVSKLPNSQLVNFGVPSNLARTLTSQLTPAAIAPPRTRPAAAPTPASPSSPPAAGTPSAFRITPGVGIGRIRLLMDVQQILSILGRPEFVENVTVSNGTPSRNYGWSDQSGGIQLWVGLDPNRATFDRAWEIQVWGDKKYYTSDGIGIGSLESEIRAVMGEPDDVRSYNGRQLLYNAKGIYFTINTDPGNWRELYNRAWMVAVFCRFQESSNCSKE